MKNIIRFFVLFALVGGWKILAATTNEIFHYPYNIVYPQFAVGSANTIEYESVLQTTNKSPNTWKGRYNLYDTGQSDGWTSPYTVTTDGVEYEGVRGTYGTGIILEPNETQTLVFKSKGEIKAGILRISSSDGFPKDDLSTTFFYRVKDAQTGELLSTLGVAPSSHGYEFILPLDLVKGKTYMGIAIVYMTVVPHKFAFDPIPDPAILKFELYNEDGMLTTEPVYTTIYAIETFHGSNFVSDMFPDTAIEG